MKNAATLLTLDLQSEQIPPTVKARQGDIARTLVISLADGSSPYPISPKSFAVLSAKKPDQTSLYNVCDILDNSIQYSFTAETASCPGLVNAEIRLYGEDEKLITTAPFYIEVYPTAFGAKDAVKSKDEQTALTKLVSDTITLKNRVNTALENGEFDGASAYEIAKRQGYSGTEQAWTESLRYDHSEEFSALAAGTRRSAADAQNKASEADASAKIAAADASKASGAAGQSKAAAEAAALSQQDAARSAQAAADSKGNAADFAQASAENAGKAAAAADRANKEAQKAQTSADRSLGMGILSAKPGDLIKIKSVDDSGKPTAWELTSLEQEEGHWELIETLTTAETALFERTREPDGTPYKFKAAAFKMSIPANTIVGDGGLIFWAKDLPAGECWLFARHIDKPYYFWQKVVREYDGYSMTATKFSTGTSQNEPLVVSGYKNIGYIPSHISKIVSTFTIPEKIHIEIWAVRA